MEDWELDFKWLKVRHLVKQKFDRKALPDLNAVLFLIGIQELGYVKKNFTKEEKQDLMHIAVCRLLSYNGYYEYVGRDADNWPHWKPAKILQVEGRKEQEVLLKQNIITYFSNLEQTGVDFSEEE